IEPVTNSPDDFRKFFIHNEFAVWIAMFAIDPQVFRRPHESGCVASEPAEHLPIRDSANPLLLIVAPHVWGSGRLIRDGGKPRTRVLGDEVPQIERLVKPLAVCPGPREPLMQFPL